MTGKSGSLCLVSFNYEQNAMLERKPAREKSVHILQFDWLKQELKPECPSSLRGSLDIVSAIEQD